MKPSELEPAPKRGQYDRALSRRDRQDAQRERVIGALAILSASERELSISNVVEVAGIGRNTFYEYFDDVDHALGAIRSRVATRPRGGRRRRKFSSDPRDAVGDRCFGIVRRNLAHVNRLREHPEYPP